MSPIGKCRSISSSARRVSRRLFSSSRCVLGLRDVAFEARDVLALDAAVRPARRADRFCAVDQLAEGDLDVPRDRSPPRARAASAISLEERLERLLDESLLDARAIGQAAVARGWRADRAPG